MPQLYKFYKKHFKAVLFIAVAGLTFLAWWNRFIQDDAFISFRYADNLVRGWGLTWNNGERVEGYTNFLWTLMMGGVIRLGGDPVIWSAIIGICCFACSLILTYRISLLIFQSDDVSLMIVVLLGTHFTFSAYATGGLETAAVTALSLGIVYMILWWHATKRIRPVDALKLSILLTLSVLMRLDSSIVCLIAAPAAAHQLLRENSPLRSRLVKVALLVVPFVFVIGCWFAWKLSYYGDILPNTFYVKVASVESIGRGFHFLHRYAVSYLLYPFPLLSIFAVRRFFAPARYSLTLLLVLMVSWMAYVVKVGGDFMEFRLLVPVMPFMFILLGWLLFVFIQSAVIRGGLVLVILFGAFQHVATFSYNPEDGIESVPQLHTHVAGPDQHWAEIGKVLGAAFHYDPAVCIATTAAGAIPYYSRLTTIDMLGLSDKFIATQGYYIGRTAGHERISTLTYLQERKVNLLISHPYMTKITEPVKKFPLVPGVSKTKLMEFNEIEIPIDSTYKLIVLYLTPNHFLDSAIEKNQWKVQRLANR